MSSPVFQIHVKSDDVNIAMLHPRLRWALLQLCYNIWKIGGVIPVITSGNDQSHSPVSLHYIFCAVDVRSRNLSEEQKDRILDKTQEELGDDFDLLIHPRGRPSEHFHLEYDAGKYDRLQAIAEAWEVDHWTVKR